MFDPTKPPHETIVRRPLARAIGIILGIVGMAGTALSDIWEPIAYSMFAQSGPLSFLFAFVPFLSILTIAAGGYFVWLSIQHPLYPTKECLEKND